MTEIVFYMRFNIVLLEEINEKHLNAMEIKSIIKQETKCVRLHY
jgi:hypothetical protein